MMQHRLKQAARLGLGRGKAGFQLVAQGHQFIDLGDDAVLLGKRWERNKERTELRCIYIL
jgi:hypothetical protein